MVEIDGSSGEGGGQILRTSLALSLVSGKAFRIRNIRANRKKPGLRRQHLAAVHAARAVGRARVEGAELDAPMIRFEPTELCAGDYRFDVGIAGSATLVLQTVLPPLLLAHESSSVTITGGTHNPLAPTTDFVDNVFLPQLRNMGACAELILKRHGFAPEGGGVIHATIAGNARGKTLNLEERGTLKCLNAISILLNLPEDIAMRECKTLGAELSGEQLETKIEALRDQPGVANLLMLKAESEHITELFTEFGEKRKRAERVARECAKQLKRYLAANVAIGPYLADQLLVPMAVLAGGSFTTVTPSSHFRTNVETIKAFLDFSCELCRIGEDSWRVEIQPGRV